MDQIKEIIDGAPDDFVVYSGDDDATLDIMKLGGVGVISVISEYRPGSNERSDRRFRSR